ncbi:unnamed protein product [Leptidea sinapis]|uniref:Uncharacterized protein n=1 Tax=Leptidea sinapis TaxID=189913 RepID=A0A5E4QBM8_9NEOP|nr:unnamed protein product [Leptidea sinapis]
MKLSDEDVACGQGLTYKAIADNFAKGFGDAVKSIIPNCSHKLLNTNLYVKPVNSSILFQKASSDKITKIIKDPNSSKAPGADGIKTSRQFEIRKVPKVLNHSKIVECKKFSESSFASWSLIERLGCGQKNFIPQRNLFV